MNLHLPLPSAIRHHLRALGTRISPFVFSLPNQIGNILLLLPVLVFFGLYVYNLRQSTHIKTDSGYEKVVWPQYFGFPDWYGKPATPLAAEDAEGEEGSLRLATETPWHPGESLNDGRHRRPQRILGLIPSDPGLHEQNVYLHNLKDLSESVNDFSVVLREAEDLESNASECWDWVLTFGSTDKFSPAEGCDTVIINEPNMSALGVDPAREVKHDITLLTEAGNQQIQSILNILYGDSFKHKNNPPKSGQQSTFGLVHQSAPSADPSTFFPDRHMSGWKRKRVTLFLGVDTQRTITEDLGRKEVIKELLPSGWSIFFEKDPLQSSKWQSVTGQQEPQDWEGAMKRRLSYDEEVATTMRNSGICLFEEEWSRTTLSHRMVQAMLSGCIVATVTPSMHKRAVSDFIIPLDPLKSLITTSKLPGSTTATLLPGLVQISVIISAYTPEELDEKALWAVMFARETFTTRQKLYEVEQVVATWRSGGRGLQLPGGYHDI